MRVLIIGGTGLLGAELKQVWQGDDQVLCVGCPEIDIRDPQGTRRLVWDFGPAWIVLAAAYTDVDGCEKDQATAYEINAAGAGTVARLAREFGSRLMYISTDYVFDGTSPAPYQPEDPINPLGIYGLTKAAGELAVRTFVSDACIVRTAWLFGRGGKCFPDTILRLAESRTELSVVADQRGCPTYNRHLAAAISRLVKAGAKGILHVTNRGNCTWYELACELLRLAGRSDVKVRPIITEELNRAAPRPKFSVLSDGQLHGYGVEMPSWQEALAEYVYDTKPACAGTFR